jgi:hypothetical protein
MALSFCFIAIIHDFVGQQSYMYKKKYFVTKIQPICSNRDKRAIKVLTIEAFEQKYEEYIHRLCQTILLNTYWDNHFDLILSPTATPAPPPSCFCYNPEIYK